MSQKKITTEQATRMLPLLRRITREIRACTRLRDRLARWVAEERVGLNHAEILGKLERLKARADECGKELSALGCELACSSKGVVNFPSERDGRAVFLTWSPGEVSVGFFFEADETHRERQLIESGDSKARRSPTI